MTVWRAPAFLWALLAIPLLGAFLVHSRRRRARALATFAEAGLLLRLAPEVAPRRRLVREVLQLTALLGGVVALAGPRWGFHWEEVRREGVDLVVALDSSKSMLAVDVKPNRLERAKLAVLDLLGLLKGDRVGLVAFAGNAFLQCPLTLDHDAFAQSLAAVDTGIIPRGGTAIARAIDTAIAAFEGREGKHAALILITDGEDHEGDVEAAAARAAEHGVRVFTVGIGTVEGELIPLAQGQGQSGFLKDRDGMVVKSRLDESFLRTIAEKTGGAYARASGDALGLDALFRDHIATMERRDLESAIERRFEDRFQLPLLLALLLLCGEALIADRAARAWQLSRLRARFARKSARPTAGTVQALVVACALVSLGFGWSGDERSSAAEGNRLYEAERYGDAVTAYGEGLADHPESERLRFNLGAAQYKSGAYEDALATLKRLTPEPGPDDGTLAVRRPAALEGKALYNAGNTRFRLAQQAEEKDLAGAVALCKEALGAYKRAMAADPEDVDAKFNHEFAARHLAELEKRLEDQRRQQERSGQEDASGQPQGEEQRQNQQEGGREERDQSAQEQQAHDEGETPEQPAGQRPKQEEPATQQAEAGGGDENRPEEQARSPEGAGAETQPTGQQASGDAGQDRAAAQARGAGRTAADAASPEGTMTAADARALVDAARGEEIDPREVPRRFAVPATVGEAAREW